MTNKPFPITSTSRLHAMTLAEVLVALVIIALGIGGAMDLFARQVNRVGVTRQRMVSSMVGRGALAKIESRGYAELESTYFADGNALTSTTLQGASKDAKVWWTATLTHYPQADPVPYIKIQMRSATGSAVPETILKSQTQEVYGYVVSQ